MSTIYKYELTGRLTHITAPKGAKAIHVAKSPNGRGTDTRHIWLLVDPKADNAQYSAHVVGTGWVCSFSAEQHVGTIIEAEVAFVWHIFLEEA